MVGEAHAESQGRLRVLWSGRVAGGVRHGADALAASRLNAREIVG